MLQLEWSTTAMVGEPPASVLASLLVLVRVVSSYLFLFDWIGSRGIHVLRSLEYTERLQAGSDLVKSVQRRVD